MTVYLPRDAWTSASRGGAVLTGAKLVGVSIHYPAAGSISLAGASLDSVIRRLQGYRSFHVNTRGWSDIGYQVCIDQAGRVWELRGIDRVPAASASASNPDANHEWGACLFLVGNNEPPTTAAIQAFRDWRTHHWLKRWPHATEIRGHGKVPGAQTACPGKHLLALIANGTLAGQPRPEQPKDWFDMATLADLRAAVRAEIAAALDAPRGPYGGTSKNLVKLKDGGASRYAWLGYAKTVEILAYLKAQNAGDDIDEAKLAQLMAPLVAEQTAELVLAGLPDGTTDPAAIKQAVKDAFLEGAAA